MRKRRGRKNLSLFLSETGFSIKRFDLLEIKLASYKTNLGDDEVKKLNQKGRPEARPLVILISVSFAQG